MPHLTPAGRHCHRRSYTSAQTSGCAGHCRALSGCRNCEWLEIMGRRNLLARCLFGASALAMLGCISAACALG